VRLPRRSARPKAELESLSRQRIEHAVRVLMPRLSGAIGRVGLKGLLVSLSINGNV
jgi:hypothetical protein